MAYTPEQRAMIALSRRLSSGYSRRVQQALLEAEAVETSFRNLNYGDRDSLGLLQQRPSQGWSHARDPAGAIRDFLSRAVALDQRGFRGTAGQLAQAVQRSAFPGRYDQHAAEVARLLGGGAGSMGAAGPPAAGISSAPASSSGDARQNLLASLITASQQSGHGRTPDYTPVFAALAGLRHSGSVESAVSPPARGGVGPSKGGSSLSFLEPFAHKFNLQITSTTEGNHVPGSYHYQGRAVDYGGDPMRMAALQRYAIAHPQEFVEVFYTGPGAAPYYVKNGRVLPIASLDRSVRDHHHNHVHLAR